MLHFVISVGISFVFWFSFFLSMCCAWIQILITFWSLLYHTIVVWYSNSWRVSVFMNFAVCFSNFFPGWPLFGCVWMSIFDWDSLNVAHALILLLCYPTNWMHFMKFPMLLSCKNRTSNRWKIFWRYFFSRCKLFFYDWVSVK